MSTSIVLSIVQFASDEGKSSAIERCESLQEALETIAEIGSKNEGAAAGFLLKNVNQAIKEILEGTLVSVCRSEDESSYSPR